MRDLIGPAYPAQRALILDGCPCRRLFVVGSHVSFDYARRDYINEDSVRRKVDRERMAHGVQPGFTGNIGRGLGFTAEGRARRYGDDFTTTLPNHVVRDAVGGIRRADQIG